MLPDSDKSKEQLINELKEMRHRVTELEASETERKRMEKEIREAQERFRGIYNSSKDAVGFATLDGILLDVNDSFCELTGYSKEELLNRTKYQDITPEEYHEYEAKIIEGIMRTGKPAEYEKEYIRKDGSSVPILLTTFVVKGDHDQPIGLAAIIKDITERKQAEDTLESVAMSSPLGIYIIQDGKFQFVNPQIQKDTGYSQSELLSMNYLDLVLPEDRDITRQNAISMLKGKRTQPYEYRSITKSGDIAWILETVTSIQYRGKRATLANCLNITERKDTEEREKQLSRLASIGELAAGVAHELNNPLTGVIGFSQRLLRKSTDEEINKYLDRILSEAQRAARVVENLRTFARPREPEKELSDINDILARTLELRAYELRTGNIQLAVKLAPNLPNIMADFHQLQEVFLNIILNAEQAMSGANRGGKLSIKTEQIKGYIRISLTDDGPGIPTENLDKLFDPFFTTRGETGGTGLGLSVCHGIVTEHGGKIYARSKPGKGATFFVELPVAPQKD